MRQRLLRELRRAPRRGARSEARREPELASSLHLSQPPISGMYAARSPRRWPVGSMSARWQTRPARARVGPRTGAPRAECAPEFPEQPLGRDPAGGTSRVRPGQRGGEPRGRRGPRSSWRPRDSAARSRRPCGVPAARRSATKRGAPVDAGGNTSRAARARPVRWPGWPPGSSGASLSAVSKRSTRTTAAQSPPPAARWTSATAAPSVGAAAAPRSGVSSHSRNVAKVVDLAGLYERLEAIGGLNAPWKRGPLSWRVTGARRQ